MPVTIDTSTVMPDRLVQSSVKDSFIKWLMSTRTIRKGKDKPKNSSIFS